MRALDIDHASRMLRAAFDVEDVAEIVRLSRLVDELDEHAHKPLPSMGAAALWYAAQGVPVFPLSKHAKTPLSGSHGFRDATTHAETIRRWWARFPASNVGIATGHVVDVIDVDGLVGNISLARSDELLSSVRGWQLGVVNTPRPGGRHIYVAPSQMRNGAKLADGIDYRGDGGYVVAPPSYVVEASYEGRYTWTKPLTLDA